MARNIQTRRKLSDLYKQGVEVRFGPDGPRIGPFVDPIPPEETEETITVWVCPPNPLQRDEAMRNAQAARAKAMLKIKRDQESEEYLTSMNFVADMGDETLVDYILLGTQEERKQDAIREVLAEDEWKDMADLQDAMRTLDEDEVPEDDPEYIALMERDTEYGKQINDRFMEITEAARETLKRQPREVLERQALEKRAILVGSERFMEAFEHWMTYYAVRDPEATDVLWYDSPRELRSEDDIIQQGIKDALSTFIGDPTEAKNLQGVVAGSSSSALPNAPEISEASIPEAATA